MRVTYEPNVLCDGEDCSALFVMELTDCPPVPVAEVIAQAKRHFWTHRKGKLLCEKCEEITRRASR